MLLLERVQQLVQRAIHDLLELVQCQIDAMVGDAALRKIVGSDALGAVAAAHLQAPRLGLGGLLLLLLGGEQTCLQQGHGARAVLVLRALILTLDDDAAGQMGDADGGIGLVDVLASGTGGAKGIDPQVSRVQVDFFDLILFRKNRDRDRGGVDATLGFGVRDSLHAVRSGFEFQSREGASARDARDDLLVPSVLAGALAQDLYGEPFGLRIAGIHAQQVTGENRGLIAPGAGADLQEQVLLIARILRNEQLAQLAFLGADGAFDPDDLLGPQGSHARIGVRQHLARSGQIALQAMVAAEALGEGLEARVLHGQVPKLLGTAGNLGGRKQPADFFEPVGHLLQALADGFLHDGASSRARHYSALRASPLRGRPPDVIKDSPGSARPVTRHEMRRGGNPRTISHVRLSKTTSLWIIPALVALLPGCSSTPPQKAAPEPQSSAASTVLAEIALKRGDCKGASESYAKAASAGTEVSLARRASEVAVACEHLPAAWQSVSRWRALAPGDREATALYAAVALKLYRMPEARAAILEFSREKPTPGGGPPIPGSASIPASPPTPGSAPIPASPSTPSTPASPLREPSGLATLAALLLEHSDASAVLAVMGGALDSDNPSPDTLALLAELSLDSFDSKRAQRYAEEALQSDGRDFAAMRVLARAYVMHGDASKAIATARLAMTLGGTRGAFELAEIFTELDRLEEAHSELERLRNTNAPTAEIDRRLALLAYDSGDFQEAGQRFSGLASNDGEASDSSLLYLSDIAARSGDPATALAGYRKLADSSVAIAARSRGAALLMARNDRAGALALLDDYAASHPESEFELTLAKARLLADHGEADTGLSLLGSALERHPSHPSIEYDKAVILEHAGRVHESVEVLEKLLTQRPDDPILTNALGYTLADHNLELPRAESLIQRALAVSPDSPAILDSLGWVRYRQGDAKGAVPTLARAYSIQHDSEIGAHWGEVLWASGARQEARRVWAAALARDPSSEALKATLTRFISDAGSPPATTQQPQPKEQPQGFEDRRDTR